MQSCAWRAPVAGLLLGVLIPELLTAQRLSYPMSRRAVVVDTIHGVAVADPYRWLEDPNSSETADWVRAQNLLSREVLGAMPMTAVFRSSLTKLWNRPRTGLPRRLRNGVIFHTRNSGLQRQDVVVARSSAASPPRVILDPNELSPDGSVALAQYSPSPEGRLLAYALSRGGADWQEVHIRDVRTGADLADRLEWVRFSALSWTSDGGGFFYSRYPARRQDELLTAPLGDHALWYHRVGTPQSEDVLIVERRDLPGWFVFAEVSDDGRYLFIMLSRGAEVRNRLHLVDLGTGAEPNVRSPVIPLVDSDDGEYTVLGNSGTTLFVRTDAGAPRRRIVAIDVARPARENWRTVVPEGPHAIDLAAATRSSIVVTRLVDVASEVSVHSLAGQRLAGVTLPGRGTVSGISASGHSPGFFLEFSSPIHPTGIYTHDAAGRGTAFASPAQGADSARFETTLHFATSKDGTRVPLVITARKGLPRDRSTATMLYGYGGFSVNMLPTFSPAITAWVEAGGAFATAILRGGAEYGEEWHRAGMLGRKQNVFDDFIATAEYLVSSGISAPGRIAIRGGSNGGLLVGAVMTQRPELFAAAIPQVGVLDMFRFHRFTGGAAWTPEYGNPDDPAAFEWLSRYSPLQNLRAGTCYPATLVTTADHDDRVVPGHSFKFAAALQHVQGCDRPVLIRIEAAGSHGYRPVDRQIDESADILSFAAAHTGLIPLSSDLRPR
ncbi:MAG: prolyl oligopeptidase family serine peptidase [Gemmatimonadota bacterium]